MIDMTPIINALIALVAALISAFLIPWLHKKTTALEREHLLTWVNIAVKAAQQMYYQQSGEVRLQYALSVLAEKGFNIDDETVKDAVEAAVLQLHRDLEAGA